MDQQVAERGHVLPLTLCPAFLSFFLSFFRGELIPAAAGERGRQTRPWPELWSGGWGFFFCARVLLAQRGRGELALVVQDGRVGVGEAGIKA